MNKAIYHTTVVYLALIILLRMMAMPISMIDYSMNRQFIAKHLCENRFRAVMSCSGKCYLHKQLAKTNDNQPGSDQKGGVKIMLIDFCENLDKPSFGMAGSHTGQTPPFQARPLITRNPKNIFHPPIA